MNIFITGGTGTLGKALLPLLVTEGHKLRVLSRKTRPKQAQIEYIEGSFGSDLKEALGEAELVIHAASDFQNLQKVDIEGTKHLLQAAQGVKHFVYISIVGVDQIPMPYYQAKVQAEKLVQASNIPHTILRITQFHNFLDMLFHASDKLPFILFPAGFKTQVIDVREASQAVVEVVKAGPSPDTLNIGGPQIYTTRELMKAWKQARRVSRPILNLPLFGKMAAGFRAGLNTCPDQTYGKITWEEWLAETYGQRA